MMLNKRDIIVIATFCLLDLYATLMFDFIGKYANWQILTFQAVWLVYSMFVVITTINYYTDKQIWIMRMNYDLEIGSWR